MKQIFKNEKDDFVSSVWLIGAVFVTVVVVFAGLFSWRIAAAKGTPVANAATQAAVVTFTHPDLHYSVMYPGDFVPRSIYPRAAQNPDETLLDESFNVPASWVHGSNLVSDSRVVIESSPQKTACSGQQFLENVAASDTKTVYDNGVTYSYAEGSKASGGNTYEEYVYALADHSPCIAVHYYIHSIDITRYANGTAQAFDKNALLAAFDGIRRSLSFSQL